MNALDRAIAADKVRVMPTADGGVDIIGKRAVVRRVVKAITKRARKNERRAAARIK